MGWDFGQERRVVPLGTVYLVVSESKAPETCWGIVGFPLNPKAGLLEMGSNP